MMTRSLFPLFCLAFVPLAFASDGVIHFSGAIVEEGCDVSHHQQTMIFDCHTGAKHLKKTVALANLHAFTLKSPVLQDVQLRYLDANKKLAVLDIVYR